MSKPELEEYNRKIAEEKKKYCYCRGTAGRDFYVCCDTGEDDCPNGGWCHFNCCADLKGMDRLGINNMVAWYCYHCKVNKGLIDPK